MKAVERSPIRHQARPLGLEHLPDRSAADLGVRLRPRAGNAAVEQPSVEFLIASGQHPWREEPLPEDPGADLVASDELPGEFLVRAEQEEELMALLNKLTEAHRSVVLLHFLEDFSIEEIAAVTNVSVGTVKSRLHYAKKSLRILLEERTT